MSWQLTLNPVRTAALSMDLQTGVVSIYTKEDKELLARAARVLKNARSSGMTVIHARVGFRPKLPEVSSRNLLLSAIKSSARHQQLFEGTAGAIHAAVAPEGDDIVVTKHRVSAFAGTHLEMILRAKDIETLILWGISTGGVVLYTALQAADADYRLIVIKDCCADLDAEMHACVIEKILPRQAAVITASEFLEGLKQLSPHQDNP
jgi:nicotinamidase-related amidase